mgnify:CR=1 FL=1
MNQELKQLQEREAELLHQINGIAAWAGLAFCVGELLEIKEVRKQIAALKSEN